MKSFITVLALVTVALHAATGQEKSSCAVQVRAGSLRGSATYLRDANSTYLVTAYHCIWNASGVSIAGKSDDWISIDTLLEKKEPIRIMASADLVAFGIS